MFTIILFKKTVYYELSISFFELLKSYRTLFSLFYQTDSCYEVSNALFCSISPSLLWGFCLFLISSYFLLIYSAATYLVAFVTEINTSEINTNSRFNFLTGSNASLFFYTLPLIFLLLLISWSGPVVVSGFGHLSFTIFERKVSILIFLFFLIYLNLFFNSTNFSNVASFDHLLTIYHFSYWLTFLFFTSNFLSLSFVIEVLTALITLLVITSYNSASASIATTQGYVWQLSDPNLPTTYLYSLLIFFWTSLLTTLSLFLFLLLSYTKFFTLEWSLVPMLTQHFLVASTPLSLFSVVFSWSFLLLVIFIKCAITPFYFWKPTFFKGLPYNTLFYYIFMFYFTIFLYFTNLLLGLFSDLLFLNIFLLMFVIVMSMFILPSILYETLNLKSFFALSSIMNSVIILIAILNVNSSSFNLFF